MTFTENMAPPCPGDLELADLVAGRLAGEARERLLHHLADCEDCYELFAVAQDLVAASEAAAAPASAGAVTPEETPRRAAASLRFPPRRSVAGWIPASPPASWPASPSPGGCPAARPRRRRSWPGHAWASCLPSRSGPRSPRSRPATAPAAMAATPAAPPAISASAWPGPTSRSLSARARPPRSETTARLLEDSLPAYFASGDLPGELSRDLDPWLAALVGASGEPPAAAGAALALLAARLDSGMAALGYEFALGRFAETGRLAAEAANPEFFDPRGEAARYLREMEALAAADRQPSRLAPQARAGLKAIAESWPPDSPRAERPWGEMAAVFAALIRSYQ